MSNIAMIMGMAAGFNVPAEFVGSGSIDNVNGGVCSVSLSAMGIQSGDMILACFSVGEDNDLRSSMTLSSSGYTELNSLFTAENFDVNMKVFAKIADGTETSVDTNSTGFGTSTTCLIVSVFRNTSGVLPTDAGTGLILSDVGSDNDDIVWSEITGLSAGDILVYFGASGHVGGNIDFNDPNDLTDFTTRGANDTEDLTAGYGYKVIDTESSFTANTWVNPQTTAGTTLCGTAFTVIKL